MKGKGNWIFFFLTNPGVEIGFYGATVSSGLNQQTHRVSNCGAGINIYNLILLPETLPSKFDKGHSLKLKTTLPPATSPALHYA